MTTTTLACPHCGNTDLHSDEIASIMYPVTMVRDEAGDINPVYAGGFYEVMDEGTVYREDHVWCRSCGTQLSADDLVDPDEDDEWDGEASECKDGCGLAVDHQPPCREKPGGRVL